MFGPLKRVQGSHKQREGSGKLDVQEKALTALVGRRATRGRAKAADVDNLACVGVDEVALHGRASAFLATYFSTPA